MCLPVVQVLGFVEVHEVPMVIQDLHHMYKSFYDVPPCFQTLHDCQKFLMVDFVVLFGWGEALGCKLDATCCPCILEIGQHWWHTQMHPFPAETACLGWAAQGWVPTVTSECTALLSWKSGFRGVSDSGFSSCTNLLGPSISIINVLKFRT